MRLPRRRAGALVGAAMGRRPADLVLRGCSLASVYTGEVLPGTEVAVQGGRVAYVGPDASHAVGPGTAVEDLGGRLLAPGLADAHTHVDQFVLPGELARTALLSGTTSLFADPVDAVSVGGARGLREFARLCAGAPVRIFHSAPGGLPVDGRFSRTRGLGARGALAAQSDPAAAGMGEVFSWTRVTSGDAPTLRAVSEMVESGRIVNGHTAGASGRKLGAYAASGISSCHEPTDYGQALERLRLGLWVMVREGSVRRDLGAILPRALSEGLPTGRMMFCTDGLDPSEAGAPGHIGACVSEAARLGMPPAAAAAMGSSNCFEYYMMGRDLGAVAPGRLADMAVFDGPSMEGAPRRVYVGGRLAAADGRPAAPAPARRPAAWTRGTVRLRRLSARDFAVPAPDGPAEARTVRLLTEIVTEQGSARLRSEGGSVAADPGRGVLKAAAFDRLGLGAGRTVGFLEGAGRMDGALASTWSFHENNLVVIGSDEGDMAAAANEAASGGGGMAAASGGRVTASMPLQAMGIMSTDPAGRTARRFAALREAAAAAGCSLARPHLALLFLPFLAIPSVRLLAAGMVDVRRRALVPVLAGG